MIDFSDDQIKILKMLKSARPYRLAEISRKLSINKSTVYYQLEELVDIGVVREEKRSPKKIFYTLEHKKQLKNIIEDEKNFLESLLIKTEIEGLEAYQDLLNLVANGEGEIIGYGNIEDKIVPEIEPMLESFRDKIALAGRLDRFVVPDSLKNIELLRDHFRKPEWKKVFFGRVIERDKMYVNNDIYVWDGTVGICNFENKKFSVSVYRDRATYETYHALLNILWDSAREI